MTLTKQFSRGSAGIARGVRNQVRLSLIHEYENYAIAKAALEDPTIRDQLIALGLNPVTGTGNGTLSAYAVDVDRDTSGRPLDPRRGYVVSGHLEDARSWLAGSFKYTEVLGEGRKYFENREFIQSIESRLTPIRVIEVGGSRGASIYQLSGGLDDAQIR